MSDDAAPLVLTLGLEPDAQQRFDDLRRRWFPAGRTRVGAHVTLFHALPGRLEAEVRDELDALSGRPAPVVDVREPRSLGRGVAYDLDCPEVVELREGWRRRWASSLTRQDDQGVRLHVTVQNKVEPAEARRTLESLRDRHHDWSCRATAVRLWRYDGGPWTHLADGDFADT